jgi:hypothetical protein
VSHDATIEERHVVPPFGAEKVVATMKQFACLAVLCVGGLAPVSASTLSFDTPLSSPGGFYNGTGGVNAGFTVLNATNSDGSSLELGLSAIQRFVGPITPSSNDYTVPLGTSGGDALWDFSFSAYTGTDSLSDYTYSLTITDQVTNATVNFDPTLLPDNSYWSGGASGAETSTKSLSTEDGFQNSENLSFSFLSVPLSFNPNSTDPYLITLAADPDSGPVDSVSIEVNKPASVVPEPGSISIATGGLFLLGIVFIKKRFRGTSRSIA